MAVWRRNALELFPDLQYELEQASSTPYSLFMELLPRVIKAHRQSDDEALQKIYGFAIWCSRQKAKDLWNAAGVSFFEHLFDDWSIRRKVVAWLPPDIVADCWSLWQSRLTEDQLTELQDLLRSRGTTRYQDAVAL